MKSVCGYDAVKELKDYGFDYLTGEADGLGMRGLYDVTPGAEQLFSDFMGGCTLTASAWNGRDNAVKSVMLAREIVKPLLIFCLLHDFQVVVEVAVKYGCSERIDHYYHCYATMAEWNSERDKLKAADYVQDWQVYQTSTAPGTGFRNRHAFSGRID